MTAICPSEQEILDKVEEVRTQLAFLNETYRELVSLGVTGDWYIGAVMTQVNLPDKVSFKKTVTTRY